MGDCIMIGNGDGRLCLCDINTENSCELNLLNKTYCKLLTLGEG